MNYYYRFIGRKKGTAYEYFVEPLQRIPIAKANGIVQKTIESDVENILNLYEKLDSMTKNGNSGDEIEKTQQAIDEAKSKIDDIVYDIYGLDIVDRNQIESATIH